jgi:hypothetical protein
MPGDGPVLSFGGPLGEDDIGGDMALRPVLRSCSRLSQGATGAQARDQLPLERTTPFDEQRLVDRFVADAHGLIIGEVERDPVRDLLRAPRRHPAPVLPERLVQPLPRRCPGPGHDRAVRSAHPTVQPLLHVLPQSRIRHQLRRLRTLGCLLRLPLRHHGAILRLAAPGRRVPAQFTRHCRRIAADAAGDLAHPLVLGLEQRDLLALGE